ncbi:MAG: lipid A biosynthesis lauroyl acyltransferase [Nevskia sp.]
MPRALLAPRWWPAWLALGLSRALCALPIRWQQALGAGLGRLVGRLAGSRRRIVRINLQLCFPALDAAAIETLVAGHFEALGIGVFEALQCWFAPGDKLQPYVEVVGIEHLDKAQLGEHGVLLLTGHFTTLEIAARLLCMTARPFHAMYRPADNPFIDWWMRRMRELRSGLVALPKDDLRALIRALRAGGAIWYAPDQTLEVPGAAFVPFFGVPALTLTATSRLAQMGRAKVVPFFPERHEGRYRITIQPALENFPSGDDVADAQRINALLEDAIRKCPEQYFWTHRRFKHRPPGAPDVYAR